MTLIYGILCVLLINENQSVMGAIEPKILLPFYGDYQLNYTIDAEEGCYKWKSLREEVATIAPIESTYNSAEDCSRSATIVVMSQQPVRKTTLLLATNVKTGTVFQSDVIVDKIHIIDIVSRTRELYLADPPEELKIRALDQDGNTFSSTAGMEFEWTLAQDEVSNKENNLPPVSAHSILHIQKFLDTIYVADNYIDTIELKGKMSDTILISGIQTGAAVVVAKLVSAVEVHKSVAPSSVRFIVRDKVMLNPAHEIYLICHTVIQYKVERWREGIPTQISMPNSQYILNVRDILSKNGAVVNLQQDTSTVVALNKGHSQVYLVDQHLKHYDSSLMEQASSDIHVVEPAYLQFDIEPNGKWILEVGKIYEISIRIYSEDNKQIYIDENIRLQGSLDKNHLDILDRVQNGSWYLVRAAKKGSCVISSLLKGVMIVSSRDGRIEKIVTDGDGNDVVQFENPIFTSQDIEIYDKIQIEPPIVLFPWQPETITYKYNFKASGGSGNYTWSVNETAASTISYTGEISTTCKADKDYGPRFVSVKATDIRNGHNFGNSDVVLMRPVKIEFALSRLESEIGTSMGLYVGMYAKMNGKLVGFTDCAQVANLHWSIHDMSVFSFSGDAESINGQSVVPSPKTSYCLMRRVHALKEGHTTVSLSYRLLGETLQTSTVVAAYKTLKIKDPVNLAVLSLGSAKTLIFEGGPNPWPLVPNSHEKIVEGKGDNVKFASKISGKEHVYIASCIRLGSEEVSFSVGNKPCSTNPFPERKTIVVRISCAVPTSLKLATDYLPDNCPLAQNQNAHTVVLGGDILKLTVTAYDKLGNQFDNFTSLSNKWKLDAISNAVIPSKVESSFSPDSFSQTKHFIAHDIIVPHELGGANLRLYCDGYRKFVRREICEPYNCQVTPAVESSIFLDIVAPVVLAPQSVVMFNRPSYSADVEISGGSGYFNRDIAVENPAQKTFDMSVKDSLDRTVVLSPLSSGHATLTVSDQCIPKATQVAGSKPSSTIIVSDLSSLVLKTSNLLEVGSSGRVSVQLDLKELSAPDSFDINIKLTVDPVGIIAVDQPVKGDDVMFHANVNALKIGSVVIKASTTARDGKIISSNAAKVTVFPPLMLKPDRITVIRDSEFHLYVEGGPPEDVQTLFDVEDSAIASSRSGDTLVAHQLGNTTVRVRAITKEGEVFHGKSHCLVHVVKMKGIIIDVPTHRFYTGAYVPVYVYGYAGPGYDPVLLDSAAAGLRFSWNVNNHAVLRLHSVHSKSGIEVPDGLKFTMLLEGRSAGRGSISVTVTATKTDLGQLASRQLQAEMQVNVFDSLAMQNDKRKNWASMNNLLLTPDTSFSLISNRDHVAKMDHFALCDGCGFNVSISEDESCISVNDEAKSVTTGKNPCFGTLLVTAHEKFGASQSLAIRVNVKTVSYLLADSAEKFYHKDSDVHLSGFPLGAKLSMEISHFDNFGQRFDLAKPDTNFRINHNELLEVTADPSVDEIKISAARVGVAVVRLWNDKNTLHYFPFPIIDAILQGTDGVSVPVGIKKCLASDVALQDGTPGKWTVNRPFSVVIDGDAVMPIVGTVAKLVYSVDNVQAKVMLTATAFSVKLAEDKIPHEITNAQSSYIIPIQILDYAHDSCPGLETEMNRFAEESFNCTGFLLNTIEPLKVFQVRSAFVNSINSYACIVDAVSLPTNAAEKVSSFEGTMFTLGLTVNGKYAERGVTLQRPVNMRFLPAFMVTNDSEVVMADGKGVLCVSATLEIHSSIEVITESRNFEVHQPGSCEEGVVCREFTLNTEDGLMTKQQVKFISTLTKQEELVSVSFKCVQPPTPSALPARSINADSPQRSDPWLAYHYYSHSYYTMLIATCLIMLLSTLIFCGLLRWMNANTPPPAQTSASPFLPRKSPGMVPYSPSNSYLFPRTSPTQQRTPGSPSSQSGGSPSPRRPQLWSTYYQPQGAGT